MSHWIYDLKNFYSSRAGRLVRRILQGHVNTLWPNVKALRVVGAGYPLPYLSGWENEAERVVALMPGYGGVHPWPENGSSRVCLFDAGAIPLETESVDRMIVVHGFEMTEEPEEFLAEIWRVLKSNGRVLIVVPNRLGFWARADWTPFGAGRPYTISQMNRLLQDNLFVRERVERALYMPPFRSFWMLKFAYIFESFGKFFFPGLAGLHIVEASKQIYAGTRVASRATSGKRRILVTADIPT
ncbi:MAG: class I SAM-dependent methyltransferase [Micavibrio sp.]